MVGVSGAVGGMGARFQTWEAPSLAGGEEEEEVEEGQKQAGVGEGGQVRE